MNRREPLDRLRAVDSPFQEESGSTASPVDGKPTAVRLAPTELSCVDPADTAFDPYNTGAFKVLAQRPRRRTLDDMRQLDAEIRRTRKPWE